MLRRMLKDNCRSVRPAGPAWSRGGRRMLSRDRRRSVDACGQAHVGEVGNHRGRRFIPRWPSWVCRQRNAGPLDRPRCFARGACLLFDVPRASDTLAEDGTPQPITDRAIAVGRRRILRKAADGGSYLSIFPTKLVVRRSGRGGSRQSLDIVNPYLSPSAGCWVRLSELNHLNIIMFLVVPIFSRQTRIPWVCRS